MIDTLREYVSLHARGAPDFKIRELTENLIDDLRMLINRRISSLGMTKQQLAAFRSSVNSEMDDLAHELNVTIEDRVKALLSDV